MLQTETVIDKTVMDALRGLFDNDAERQKFIADIVVTFEQTGTEVLAEMSTAHAAGDRTFVGRLAHKLKGMGRNVGAIRLTAACQTLESEAPNLAADETEELRRTLAKEFELSCAELQRYCLAG